jgi:hypothetical protein
MAAIFGNISPSDDYTHDPGSRENFNESIYFNFCDERSGIGGFMRMGNRPNQGHAEYSVVVYLEGGRVLYLHDQAPITDNARFAAGGMQIEVLEPTQRLRTRFSGSIPEIADPSKLIQGHDAVRDAPTRRLELRLVHEAVGPIYSGEHPDNGAFDFHFEQHMAVRGELRIDTVEIPIHGYGLRDHSWGPRSWDRIQDYAWLTMNFGAELGVKLYTLQTPDGEETRDSWIVRGDHAEPVVRARIRVISEPGGLVHREIHATAEARDGEHLEISGRIEGYVPLQFRTPAGLTLLGEGLTRWQCGDSVGHGLAEVMHQLP